jgi:hypothetical protein
MATLAEIRTKVDNWLADKWVNVIVPKEEAYFAKHGRYAQVLISPESLVADGADGTFTKRPPSDEQFEADFTLTFDTPIPAQIEIHTHDAGEQHGFTGHVWVEVNGELYHRAKNYQFGSPDEPWHKFIPPVWL